MPFVVVSGTGNPCLENPVSCPLPGYIGPLQPGCDPKSGSWESTEGVQRFRSGPRAVSGAVERRSVLSGGVPLAEPLWKDHGPRSGQRGGVEDLFVRSPPDRHAGGRHERSAGEQDPAQPPGPVDEDDRQVKTPRDPEYVKGK